MAATALPIAATEDRFLLPSYPKLPFAIERGDGMYVFDQEGRKYLDMYGGHAVSLVGHNHPKLLRALSDQASKLLFYSSVSYSGVRARAAEALVNFVGGGRRVFFSNSGAEANENAIKIARLLTGRSRVMSLEGSFHGRTLGTLAVTGIEKYRKGLGEAARDVDFARFGDLDGLRAKMKDDVACLIVEPIQSLNGVRTAPAKYFQDAAALCRGHGALLILDEIQTGLGRCGASMFHKLLGIDPDIVTLAKGLAGGFPIGATLVRADRAERVQMGDLGSTFGGGPLACALLLATLDVLGEENLAGNAESLGGWLRQRVVSLPIREVRGAGLLVGFELAQSAAAVQKAFLEKGILVGTSLDPNTIRLLPPLTVKQREIETFVQALADILKENEHAPLD